MELKDKINNMPAWKLFVLIIVGISMVIYSAEEIVIGKVFEFANRIVDSFEVQAIKDKQDVDRDVAEMKADEERVRKEGRDFDAQMNADIAASDKVFNEHQRIEAEFEKNEAKNPHWDAIHASGKNK